MRTSVAYMPTISDSLASASRIRLACAPWREGVRACLVCPSLRITRSSIANRRRHTRESTPGRTRIERLPDRKGGGAAFSQSLLHHSRLYLVDWCVRISTERCVSRGRFWFLNDRRETRSPETKQILPWAKSAPTRERRGSVSTADDADAYSNAKRC
ncbi:hypothetical protein LX32DRAFT_378292 [Colletotrichum zoysiae]|uniref:Uncharacterized protein n=1 Tax=Colletotrichum zoysiae TaxID=1216348 RepID=A0AAD9HHM8_9PEZI|nr:hypothetical protein LX32DRAFT_378292 [Colletotrichum zoysiae]